MRRTMGKIEYLTWSAGLGHSLPQQPSPGQPARDRCHLYSQMGSENNKLETKVSEHSLGGRGKIAKLPLTSPHLAKAGG